MNRIHTDAPDDLRARLYAGDIFRLPPTEASQALVDAVRAVREEAARLGASVSVEVSGGIDLDNVRAVADRGVDRLRPVSEKLGRAPHAHASRSW